MLDALPLQFERPIWLLLLLLIIPCYFLGRRSIGGLSRAKATTAFALRIIVILLLTMALAEPIWEKRGEGVTTTIILDRSDSIPLPLKRSSVDFFEAAIEGKDRREDQVAVITVAKDASIEAMPDEYSTIGSGQYDGDHMATNLAAAVRLALAIAPDDTANRIVLVSDGNETEDSVMAAADIAKANGVPIDVAVLEYEHDREVMFETVVAPARARQGQTANVKLVLRSQHQTTGEVQLQLNELPVDLNGEAPGEAMAVELRPGPNVFTVPLSLDEPGPKRFQARFIPANPQDDRVLQNNEGVAVTFVGGEGRVLIIDDGNVESEYLMQALQEANISTDRINPDGLVGGLVFLSGYDSVILANIPRYAFNDEQDEMLHRYVHDLGGGLIMLGGPQSFGAGGWIDSEVSRVLPVKLDPPSTRQMPRGALALIMHSCEMPQGNFWGQKVAESAIEALSRLDYVGIIEFNWGAAGPQNGASWAFPMQIVGDKSAALNATKTMVVGDMPDFGASMSLAITGLTSVRAGQRHAIIISDGDPSPPSTALLSQYVSASITVTTVMVGGHGTAIDRSRMQAVANKTGGTFYNVTNPKQLPAIFIKEAQLVSRSLIQEGDLYSPAVTSRLPGPTEGFTQVPQIDGYVLTAKREGLTQTPIINRTSEGDDPILAFWNYGLGKSVAYTSDLTGRWGGRWVNWSEFRAFWEQVVRWSMRPTAPVNMLVNTRIEGDRAIVELEALAGDASYLNFLKTQAVVLGPSRDAEPLQMQQTGPGKYRGEFRVDDAGSYLVNVHYTEGGGEEAAQGHIQAAVSVPYAREFRSTEHNAALLLELANQTGGRQLAMTDASLVNLFDRTDLEVPKAPKYIWQFCAILAAVMFIMDVAARRLSIDAKWLAALAGRAVGRQQETSTGAVAAWKRTKQQASRQSVKQRIKSQAEIDRTVRFEADEKTARTAIDVGAQGSEVDRSERAAEVERAQSKPAETEGEDGDYTSRLLRAKRRARGDESDSDNPHPGAGGDQNG